MDTVMKLRMRNSMAGSEWTTAVTPADRRSEATFRARLLRGARENDGSTLIEAAFVLPTFFLLLFGIFEFSLLLAGYCSAGYAVRMAARNASVHSSTSLAPATSTNVQSLVQANLFMPGASSSTITVDYTQYNAATGGNSVGNIVNVGMGWSQSINLPGYQSTLTLSTQTHRVIVR